MMKEHYCCDNRDALILMNITIKGLKKFKFDDLDIIRLKLDNEEIITIE